MDQGGFAAGFGAVFSKGFGPLQARLAFQTHSQAIKTQGTYTNSTGVEETHVGEFSYSQTFISVDGFYMPEFVNGFGLGFRLGYFMSADEATVLIDGSNTSPSNYENSESGIGMGASFVYDLRIGSVVFSPEVTYVMGILGVSDAFFGAQLAAKYAF